MIVIRNGIAINLDNVTSFTVNILPKGSKYNQANIIFSFNYADGSGINDYKAFEFLDEEDAEDAFNSLLNFIEHGDTKVFYMDDEELWGERNDSNYPESYTGSPMHINSLTSM